jgi:hypothetical protein
MKNRIHRVKEIDISVFETELLEMKYMLGNLFGDIICFSKSNPKWLIEKYNIDSKHEKKFLKQIEAVCYYVKEIRILEEIILQKKSYWKNYEIVKNIVKEYDDKIERVRHLNHSQKCVVDRKTDCNLFDTTFDIFLGKQCAWNILLEKRRQLLQQEGQYLSRKGFLNDEEEEYEQKERKI